jgi:hypothetical protein
LLLIPLGAEKNEDHWKASAVKVKVTSYMYVTDLFSGKPQKRRGQLPAKGVGTALETEQAEELEDSEVFEASEDSEEFEASEEENEDVKSPKRSLRLRNKKTGKGSKDEEAKSLIQSVFCLQYLMI